MCANKAVLERRCGATAERVFVVLSAAEREQLAAIVADRNHPRKQVKRTRIVLASAERVAQSIGVSRLTVWRWQERFAESGVEGLLRDKDPQARQGTDRGGYHAASGGADMH